MNKYKRNYLKFLTHERLSDGTIVVLPDEMLNSIDKIEVTPDGLLKFKCKMKVDISKMRFVHGSGA